MLVKCPSCATDYNIPDTFLSSKDADEARQRKMRCYKCKTIFSVSSDKKKTKKQYEEFAEPQTTDESELFSDSQSTDEKNLLFEVFSQNEVDETSSEAVVKNASSWTLKNALDLGEYATENKKSFKWFSVVFSIAAAVVLICFFTFVSAKNEWSLSISNISEQISIAFYGKQEIELPSEVKGLVISPLESYELVAKDGRKIIVAKGRVENTLNEIRTAVILEAKLIDKSGKVRRKITAPCGRNVNNKKLKKSKRGTGQKLFKIRGKDYNCKIAPQKTAKYKIFFEDLPEDYNNTFVVELKAIFAKRPIIKQIAKNN